jgi:hypothetical protein
MPGVFICYRREDTGGAAGRLYDRLCAHFGSGRVFRDVDTIAPGDRFDQRIDERLARADVLIALIGREWMASTDAEGRVRLHAPDDFVRREIATALARHIPVIPALFGNAPMPRADELPSDLTPLARCQAIEIDDADFHDDVNRLITVLEGKIRPDESSRASTRRSRVAATLGFVALAGAVLLALVVLGRGAGWRPSVTGGTDSEAATRSSAPDVIALRSEPTTLTPEEVRATIVEHGFFSTVTNPGAKGIVHEYAQEVREGWTIVVDRATGLTWEHGGSGRPLPGRAGAAEYVSGLNDRRAGGFDGWRLPTLEEALSLLTPEAHGDFHIDPAFAASDAPFIWSADDEAEGRGWVVYYVDGFASIESTGFNAYVRAVRSNQSRGSAP